MRIFSAILLSSSLALTAIPAWAATLTVTGEGAVETVPDMALVSLGVTTEGKTAAEAMTANSDGLAAVLAQLTSLGIKPEDMQTSALSLNPNWTGHDTGSPVISGYMASNMVTLRLRDLDGLGSLLDATIAGGANTLNGISFEVSEPKPLLDAARAEAVADAKARAEVLATAAGVKLGAIETIAEGGSGGGGGPMFKSMAAESAVPIAAGEVVMSASVTITWQIAE